MDKQQFTRIIELQRLKMVGLNKATTECYIQGYNLLNPTEQSFIGGFTDYLNQEKEERIVEWIKQEAWNKGWSLQDIFYHSNLKPIFPLLYKEYWTVPEKDNRTFKHTYKNLSKVLFDKYPFLQVWRTEFSKNYELYRRALLKEGLNELLAYGDETIYKVKGISTSSAADILSKMRAYSHAPRKKMQIDRVIKKLKDKQKQEDIAREEGISQGQVSKIKAKMERGLKCK